MFRSKLKNLQEFSKSFLFRSWLSVVLVYTIVVLSVQLTYICIASYYNDEWQEIYHTEIVPILSELILAANHIEKSSSILEIERLAEKYDDYLLLFYLGEATDKQNIIKAHKELFQISNIKQNQLIYFTDKNQNLYLLEVKNPSHSVLFFSLSIEGFILRSIPIFVLILIFTFFWSKRFLFPVAELIRAAQQVGKGTYQTVLMDTIHKATPEIKELCQTFNVMVENLEKLQKSQQEMISDIAHELRSPLARQKLALNLLKEGQFNKYDYTELLDRVENEGTRLNELIDEILNYLRPLQSQQIAIEQEGEDIYLASLLEAIIDDASFEFSNQNKGIDFDIKESFIIRGNYLQLERAVENIIRNALFHTQPLTKIFVMLRKDPTTNEAVIVVRDHGFGVPEESIPFLTKPFYRIDSARNKKDGGYGLGLTITDEIILSHQGSLSFENGKDDGLIVTIRLPIINV